MRYCILIIALILNLCFSSNILATLNYKELNKYTYEILSDSPLIIKIFNFLNDSESNQLIKKAAPMLTRSTITNKLGRSYDPSRTSFSAYLNKVNNLNYTIRARAAKLVNLPLNYVEPLQVVHYDISQEYKPHFDYFAGDEVLTIENNNGGQRRYTLFVYLNDLDDASGGHTIFPKLNINITPKKNMAVFWVDSDANSNVDPRTLHGGAPVLFGEKWGLNVWIRAGEFGKSKA